MYFFMIRPQQRKAREHADMLAALKVGDEVVTSGGVIGRIRSVAKEEGFVSLEVANNVIVKVLKPHIAGLTRAESAKSADKTK
jgi:preprotein translocase subunit YajC